MSLKRINKEIEKLSYFLKENNLYYTLNSNNDSDIYKTNTIKITITIYSKERKFLEFVFPNDYPFKPYSIYLFKEINTLNNIIRYDKWLSNIKIIDNKYHKLFMNCLLKKNFNLQIIFKTYFDKLFKKII